VADSIFSAVDIERLFEERFLHPHPMVQKRLEALYLSSQGMKHKDIALLLRISPVSISNWLRVYKESGLEGVKALNYRKKWGELSAHQPTLEEYFKQHPPRTVQEAIRVIKKITGLDRKYNSVYRFLKITGLSYRKSGIVPGKADHQAQEDFKKKSLNQGWKMQKMGKEKCFS